MRPMAPVLGGPVQGASLAPLYPIWLGLWCFPGQPKTGGAETGGAEWKQNQRLSSFSFATECLLLTQMSTNLVLKIEPSGDTQKIRDQASLPSSTHPPPGPHCFSLPLFAADCKLLEGELLEPAILFCYFCPEHPAQGFVHGRCSVGMFWVSECLQK